MRWLKKYVIAREILMEFYDAISPQEERVEKKLAAVEFV